MTVAESRSTEVTGKRDPADLALAPTLPNAVAHSEEELDEHILRFPIPDRIEHIITIVSFTVLATTGLPQMYSTWPPMQAAATSL